MIIAITGANGYIGRYVQKELEKDSELSLKLITIDDSNSPYIKIDYSPDSLRSVFTDSDVVVHLAAIKNVKTYKEMEENINLTERIMQASLDTGIRKIIYASSISVYSDETGIPWKEGLFECPISLYGLSKLAAEHLIRIRCRQNKCKYTFLRFAHVIGDNMPGTYMIPTFFRNAEKGIPLKVVGKSIARRELVDVLDIARAIHWAITNEVSDNQTVNIGTGIGLTNLEIANAIAENGKSPVLYEENLDENISSSVMNIEKASSLGFYVNRSPLEAIRRIKQEQGE